ncbi:MAG: ATP-dependent nuclease subunit B [Deinococcota bacterium]
MNIVIGPPAAGKTARLLQVAKRALEDGQRVWWVGLPSQRNYIYRRATAESALLGLEFLSSQQVYYRLLAAAQALKPLLVGTGRIAYVGEALKLLEDALPSPGEARLFSRAIAEAKRYGHSADSLATTLGLKTDDSSEMARLCRVFRQYEQVKGERWDYDDFRSEALNLALAGKVNPEADVIIVDGFRELGPLEWQLYLTLSQSHELWLSLPELPPSVDTSAFNVERLSPPAQTNTVHHHLAPNPISESRWVLRALKRDLAEGLGPLELAVILPPGQLKAFSSLADEYGIPLMDETPKALADTPLGNLLLNVLELPDYPTASRLLAIPELSALANAALERNVAGREALTVLAEELGLADLWQRWLTRLEVPSDELAWAQDLTSSLPSMLGVDGNERLQDHMLERAKEASVLAKGASFRAWWAALLQETFIFERPRGGIALLTATLASGRRFTKAYVMHATEGAYSVGEKEDYFISEDVRVALTAIFGKDSDAGTALPKRFLGRDQLLFQELVSRAEVVTITYPEADQGGPLAPETDLLTASPTTSPSEASGDLQPLPALPLGSRLELANPDSYHANISTLNLGGVSIESLAFYDRCAFRFWAQQRLRDNVDDADTSQQTVWWRQLIKRLREYGTLNQVRLETLQTDFPAARHWLSAQQDALMPLSYGVYLPERRQPQAHLDAASRTGEAVTLTHFVAPGSLPDDAKSAQKAAEDVFNRRWTEQWTANYLLTERGVSSVKLVVWPVLGEPCTAHTIDYPWRRIVNKTHKVSAAYMRFQRGDTSPQPGFICRECPVFDICREGTR